MLIGAESGAGVGVEIGVEAGIVAESVLEVVLGTNLAFGKGEFGADDVGSGVGDGSESGHGSEDKYWLEAVDNREQLQL